MLADIVYTPTRAENIRCSGPFESFGVVSRKYHTGVAMLPMCEFHRARVLDLTAVLVPKVFSAPGSNLLQQTESVLTGIWTHVLAHELFILPRNPNASPTDIPDVCFAVTMIMLQKGVEFVVVDPIHKGTDAEVRIINFSHALRELQCKRVRVQTTLGDGEKALSMIMYQRGAGNPDAATYAAMEAATGLRRDYVMHCHLTPGKYEKDLFGGNCYRDFAPSVAKILHELSIIDPYSIKKGADRVKNVFFVLDMFSGYSAFTVVAILGYGLESVATVLAYHRGVFTPLVFTPLVFTPLVFTPLV